MRHLRRRNSINSPDSVLFGVPNWSASPLPIWMWVVKGLWWGKEEMRSSEVAVICNLGLWRARAGLRLIPMAWSCHLFHTIHISSIFGLTLITSGPWGHLPTWGSRGKAQAGAPLAGLGSMAWAGLRDQKSKCGFPGIGWDLSTWQKLLLSRFPLKVFGIQLWIPDRAFIHVIVVSLSIKAVEAFFFQNCSGDETRSEWCKHNPGETGKQIPKLL